MKKIILTSIIAIALFSCSKSDSDCDSKRSEINATYDKQIKQAGNDTRQVGLLEIERQKKLSEACK
jgi:hypothetical protein